MVEVFRVTNRAAFTQLESLRKLLTVAFEPLYGTGTKDAIEFLAANCETFGVFVGLDGVELCALTICILPDSPLMAVPQVLASLNTGPEEAMTAVHQAMLAFCSDAGYNRLWCINQSGHSDAAFKRQFKYAGKAKTLGSLLEFKWE